MSILKCLPLYEQEVLKDNKGLIKQIYEKWFNYKNTCGFCNKEVPRDFNYFLNSSFDVHVYFNEDELEKKPKFIILCNACHLTQHLQILNFNDYFFVNSVFKQSVLIDKHRTDEIDINIESLNIAKLSREHSYYLDALLNNDKLSNIYLKIIYNSKFFNFIEKRNIHDLFMTIKEKEKIVF